MAKLEAIAHTRPHNNFAQIMRFPLCTLFAEISFQEISGRMVISLHRSSRKVSLKGAG
jgi:hypothetical protein